MKAFISWSGTPSREIAETLADWIPRVIQSVKPWMSTHGIGSGEAWFASIVHELTDAKAGILCMTPNNLAEPWLMFEGGAMAKTVEKAFCCPYLFKVEPVDLVGPLTQYQARRADKVDTLKLLDTLNAAAGQPLSDENLRRAFDKWWPDLDAKFSSIELPDAAAAPERPARDILEEILETVRALRADQPVERGWRRLVSAGDPMRMTEFRSAGIATALGDVLARDASAARAAQIGEILLTGHSAMPNAAARLAAEHLQEEPPGPA